jgi:hypothetical protein
MRVALTLAFAVQVRVVRLDALDKRTFVGSSGQLWQSAMSSTT